MKYTNRTEWDDKAKQFIFKKGLKIEVFIELMCHDIAINTLDDLIEATIKIDDKLYQLRMMTRPPKPNKYYQNCSAGYYAVRRNREPFIN